MRRVLAFGRPQARLSEQTQHAVPQLAILQSVDAGAREQNVIRLGLDPFDDGAETLPHPTAHFVAHDRFADLFADDEADAQRILGRRVDQHHVSIGDRFSVAVQVSENPFIREPIPFLHAITRSVAFCPCCGVF